MGICWARTYPVNCINMISFIHTRSVESQLPRPDPVEIEALRRKILIRSGTENKDGEGPRPSSIHQQEIPLFSLIADAPNGSRSVIADQQRSIFRDGNTNRTAPDISVSSDEAGQKLLVLA